MNKFDLNNKNAIITGGAQGFGLDIAKRFLQSGAKVIIWDSDEKELIKAVVDIYAIYVNNNYCISELVFNVFSKKFLIEEIFKLIEAKSTGETKKIKFSLSILMACLGDSLSQEKVITPSCVAETKKACLLYLAS